MLTCAFCHSEISQRLSTLLERVETCAVCGAKITVNETEQTAREAIAAELGIEPQRIDIASSPTDGQLLLICGWDPGEPLGAVQIAAIIRKSKPMAQQHLREGRFEGARRAETGGGRPYWQAPRASVLAYLRAGRKPYTVRPGVERGRPPKGQRPATRVTQAAAKRRAKARKLRKQGLTLAEIAEELGYSDASAVSRALKTENR